MWEIVREEAFVGHEGSSGLPGHIGRWKKPTLLAMFRDPSGDGEIRVAVGAPRPRVVSQFDRR